MTNLVRSPSSEPLGPISVNVSQSPAENGSKSPAQDSHVGLLTTATGNRRGPKRLKTSSSSGDAIKSSSEAPVSSTSSGSAGELQSVSPVSYPTSPPLPFQHTPSFFSLFLNAPLIPPSQWLYSQLYPHPYSHLGFRHSLPQDSPEPRKSSPSPVRAKSATPPTNTAKSASRHSDVWRPY